MDPSVQPIESATMPIISEWAAKMVRMIDKGFSIAQIFVILRQSPLYAEFKVTEDQSVALEVELHWMSRPLIRSILCRHLGPDLWDMYAKEANYKHVYRAVDTPGAYIGFMHVEGRDGAFLTRSELEKLINSLCKYATGVDAYDADSYGNTQMDDDEREALRYCRLVDDFTRPPNDRQALDSSPPSQPTQVPEYPRFAHGSKTTPKSERSKHIRYLTDLFQQFLDKSNQHGGPDAPIHQSPMLVGNTMVLSRQMESLKGNDSMLQAPKTWTLTYSILQMEGVDVRPTIIPMVLAPREQDVNNSEVLGTILADSMLPGCGFNAKVPGTRPLEGRNMTRGLKDNKGHIENAGWAKGNIILTREKTMTREKYEAECEAIQAEIDAMVASIDEL